MIYLIYVILGIASGCQMGVDNSRYEVNDIFNEKQDTFKKSVDMHFGPGPNHEEQEE